MKKEKYAKKLTLSKTTISNLEQIAMNQIGGGQIVLVSDPPRCDSIEIRCNSHTGCTGCPIEC